MNTIKNIYNLPLIFLICCGRSGSLLLHSLIDGHPEILHIPQVFKFFDFYFTYQKTIHTQKGCEIAELFFRFSSHERLFDSTKSDHLNGRLGRLKTTQIKVSFPKFREKLSSILDKPEQNFKIILKKIIIAYLAACKIPIKNPRAFLLHLHHGDWLKPDLCLDKSNLGNILFDHQEIWPDKILISLRNPADALASVANYVSLLNLKDEDKSKIYEKYLLLLIQDWFRVQLIQKIKINFKFVRLEDLRIEFEDEIKNLAEWLNITPSNILNKPTFYSFEWWGDIYSKSSNKIHRPVPPILPSLSNQDHVYLYSQIGDIAGEFGYRKLPTKPLLNYNTLANVPLPNRKWLITDSHKAKIINDRIHYYNILETIKREIPF